MAQVNSTSVQDRHGGPATPSGGGYFQAYKKDQGHWTRLGSFIGAAALILWGAAFLNDRLSVIESNEAWTQVVVYGIPVLFAAVLGGVAYRVIYVKRASSDFMIATEGEMKKVNWSSRNEVIGSTKVVIVVTLLMAVLLFGVDMLFQNLGRLAGVLKGS